MIAGLVLALALQTASFDEAANGFSACLVNVTKMGMTTKMKPADFQIGFAKSCKAEEAVFRVEGIKRAIELGRTPDEAAAEVAGNIANGRRIYAADQAKYVETGVVPR